MAPQLVGLLSENTRTLILKLVQSNRASNEQLSQPKCELISFMDQVETMRVWFTNVSLRASHRAMLIEITRTGRL